LISFGFIDEWLKIIKGYTPEVGDDKENLLSVFSKLPFTSTKIDLTLEYKCLKFIRTAPTKQVWFPDPFVPLLQVQVRSSS